MTKFNVAVMTAAALFATAAAPAFAKEPKPITVTVPAVAVPTSESKLCMVREVLGRKVDKTLPATICETRDEWAARGVNVVVK
jgi:hypothetical protein